MPTILKNYDIIPYMQKMVEIYTLLVSGHLTKQRLKTMSSWIGKGFHLFRIKLARQRLGMFKELLHLLQTDRQFLAFQTGEMDVLPDF